MFGKIVQRITFCPSNILQFLGKQRGVIICTRALATSSITMGESHHTLPWPKAKKSKFEENETSVSSDQNEQEKPSREKRRMFAILLAYSGVGYQGLQRNAGFKTIEEELLVALKSAGVLTQENFERQQNVRFQRAARTDKGVSALRQIISLSIREGVTPEELNVHLPEQVKVLAIRRVTKGFHSKNSCDSRTYSYTCPTFALAPKEVAPSEDYRITSDVLEKLQEPLKLFMGTHNFYNFTSGRRPRDPSCSRFIIDVTHKPPVVEDGLELITFLIKGQSFMLHQIRKMMGIVISIMRGYYTPDIIPKSFNADERVDVPVAPGLGLLLEQIHYDRYNKRYGDDGFHEKLDFVELEDQVEEFRRKHIYPTIIKMEKEQKSMMTFINEELPLCFETGGEGSQEDIKTEEVEKSEEVTTVDLAAEHSINQVEIDDATEENDKEVNEEITEKSSVSQQQ